MDLKTNTLLACEEHVDIVIDEFVNDNDTFPELIFNNNGKCCYCKKEAKYEVK